MSEQIESYREKRSKEIMAYVELAKCLAKTIRELGEVPSGHLYAMVMGQMNLEQYNRIIQVLKDTKCIEERNYLLKWVGQPKDESAKD